MTWKTELSGLLGSRVERADHVAGGDINDSFRVSLADKRVVFVKTHDRPPAGMFAAEAAGLDWLRAGPLRIPAVLGVGDHWLALEFLDTASSLPPTMRGRSPFAVALGRGLAQLHRVGAPSFGFGADNFLATLPQPNAPVGDDTWPSFYVERRLRPLATLAASKGRMPNVDAKLDALLARPDRFGAAEPPARLHGDLWWGNVCAVTGEPALIDPAVYGGHREIDLAMLALFGELPDELVDAYHEIWPLSVGWRERLTLHQLYPLTAHAVLFGGSYGAQVARSLDELI